MTIGKSTPQKQRLASKKDGLFHLAPDSKPLRISAPIRVRAYAFDPATNEYWVQITFRNLNDKRKRILVPRGDLRRPEIIRRLLENNGFVLPEDPDHIRMLIDHLVVTKPKKNITITRVTGWHGKSFVLPDVVFGEGRSELMYINLAGQSPPTGGSLNDWQLIPKLAAHSSRMTLAICASLGAPIAKLASVESGGFNYSGSSSKGKSGALKAANSVYDRSGQSDIGTWASTETGLEEQAANHSDRILVIDEVARGGTGPRALTAKIREAAYQLASGHGRLRSKHYGNGRETSTWLTSFLSSSETSLSRLADISGDQRPDGELVRLIDIPAIVHPDYGIYETVPPDMTSRELSESIEAAAKQYYGVAGREFIRQVVENYDEVCIQAQKLLATFLQKAAVPNSGWENRFGKRFALAYVGGMLGIEYGILPWNEATVFNAVVTCYQDARKAIPDFEALLQAAIKQLQRKLNKKDRFLDLRGQSRKSATKKVSGYIKDDEDHGLFIAVKPRIFKKWVGETIPYKMISDHLFEHDWLVTTSRGLPTKPVKIKGIEGKPRYYCIKEAFFKT